MSNTLVCDLKATKPCKRGHDKVFQFNKATGRGRFCVFIIDTTYPPKMCGDVK